MIDQDHFAALCLNQGMLRKLYHEQSMKYIRTKQKQERMRNKRPLKTEVKDFIFYCNNK